MQRARQVRPNRQLQRYRPIVGIATTQGVPREAQFSEALNVGLRLVGNERDGGLRAVRRADAKDSFPSSKAGDPFAVAMIIPIAGMTQTARVRMDHSHNREKALLLA